MNKQTASDTIQRNIDALIWRLIIKFCEPAKKSKVQVTNKSQVLRRKAETKK